MEKPVKRPARLVSTRKATLLTTAAVSGLALAQPVLPYLNSFGATYAQTAEVADAGEAGEAGEAGATDEDAVVHFLEELGEYEATQRIAAGLYAAGRAEAAVGALYEATYGEYEVIEHELEEFGAPEFGDVANAFTSALRGGAAVGDVAERADALFAAIHEAIASIGAAPSQQVKAIHELANLATDEFAEGVVNGAVVEAEEYRFAWGLVETARARATGLAASADAATADAGRDVLAQIGTTDGLFTDLTAETVTGDPTLLAAASAWIEIISLRLD